MSNNMAYSGTAPTHLGAGVDLPRASANGRSSEASFFTPKFYDGLIRGASARRPRSGKINSVKPVTLLIDLNGGSSLNLNEDTTMSNDYDVPLCHLTLGEMLALKAYLIQLTKLHESGIKLNTRNTPELISACKKIAASLEVLEGAQ